MKLNKLISISLLAALSVTGAMAQDHYLTSVAAYTDSYLSLEDGSETVYLPAAWTATRSSVLLSRPTRPHQAAGAPSRSRPKTASPSA